MLRAHVAASVAALTAAGRSMRGPPRLPRVAPRAPVAPPRRYCHRRSSGHGQGRHGRNQSGAAPDEHQHRGVAWQETVRLAHEAASRISHSVKNPGSAAPQMGAWAKRHSILCPHGAQAIAQVLRRCLSTASDSAADTPPSFQAANNAWREAHQARHGWNPPAWAYAGFGEFHPGRYRHWTSDGSWSTGETSRTRSETAAPQTPPPVMDTSTPPSQPQHATPSPTAPHSTASLVCSFIRRGLIGIFNTVALGALGIIYIVSAIYFIGLMLVIVLCTIMMWIEAARDKAKAKAKAEGKKPAMWVAKANDTPPVEVSSSLICFLVIVAFLVIACGSPATTDTEQSKAVTQSAAAAPVEKKPPPPKPMHSAPAAPAAASKAAQLPPAPASEALAEHAAVAQAAEALARVVRSLRL